MDRTLFSAQVFVVSRNLLVISLCALSACLGPEVIITEAVDPVAPGPQVLRPGQMVRVTFAEQPNLSGVYLIEDDGAVAMPLLGYVEAGGLGTELFRQSVRKAFSERSGLTPAVEVEVLPDSTP